MFTKLTFPMVLKIIREDIPNFLPEPPTYPTDIDWKSINYSLAHEIFSLRRLMIKINNTPFF